MKVFVSGATGFIGSAVLGRLAKAGHSVKGLVQDSHQVEEVKKAGGIAVVGDLLVPGKWSDEVKDCDVVISASSPYRMGEKLSLAEADRRAQSHAEEVINLLHAAAGSKVQAVVLTYHVTALGNQGDRWASEILTIDPVGLARPIAGTYWDIEKAARKLGIQTIEVFPGWVYGQRSWLGGFLVPAIMEGTAHIVGAGTNHMSLIHIDDLAEGFKLILDKMPFGERYCLVDGHPVTQSDFLHYLSNELMVNAPQRIEYREYAKEYGEVMAEAMDSSVRVTNDKAKKELGFKPVFESFVQGIPDILDRMGVEHRTKTTKKAVGF